MTGWWSVALAETLRVEDARVEEVRAVVGDLWPGGELEVQPLLPGAVPDGFVWSGRHLVWLRGGTSWSEPADDAPTAVLLARVWLLHPPPAEAGVPPEERDVDAALMDLELAPQAPAPRAARPAAARGVLAVGAGAVLDHGGAPDALRVSGELTWPSLDLGLTFGPGTRRPGDPARATGTATADDPARETSFARYWREVARTGAPGPPVTSFELTSLSLTGSWTLGLPRRAGARWSAVPIVAGGARAARVVTAALDDDGAVVATTEGKPWLFGLFGFGAEAWWSEHAGIRAVLLDRIGEDALRQQLEVAIDLRVAVKDREG